MLLLSGVVAVDAKKDRSENNKRHDGATFQRVFDVPLSFAQELVPLSPPPFLPRPASEAPHGTFGRLLLCFAKDLSSVKFKLYVFNALGKENPNERITQAHLHAGAANVNGPVFVFLKHPVAGPCGQPFDGLVAEGTLTNADIITPSVSSPSGYLINSIAALYEGIRRGEVYANVHGSNCTPNLPGYATGIVRGQIFTNDVTE
jgi:hypothetical protein